MAVFIVCWAVIDCQSSCTIYKENNCCHTVRPLTLIKYTGIHRNRIPATTWGGDDNIQWWPWKSPLCTLHIDTASAQMLFYIITDRTPTNTLNADCTFCNAHCALHKYMRTGLSDWANPPILICWLCSGSGFVSLLPPGTPRWGRSSSCSEKATSWARGGG